MRKTFPLSNRKSYLLSISYFLSWFILRSRQDIMQFVRAQRERNFLLYIHVVKASMKYIYALNHHHYARWLSVHLDDLLRLPNTSPKLYEEFLACNFVLHKTDNPFSAIALDQGHKQNDATIKGAGRAVRLLSSDMESVLW